MQPVKTVKFLKVQSWKLLEVLRIQQPTEVILSLTFLSPCLAGFLGFLLSDEHYKKGNWRSFGIQLVYVEKKLGLKHDPQKVLCSGSQYNGSWCSLCFCCTRL